MTHVDLEEWFLDDADVLQSLRVKRKLSVDTISSLLVIINVGSHEVVDELAELGLDLVDTDVSAPDDHGGSRLAVLRGRNQFTAGRETISRLGAASNSDLTNSLL